jgi:hypothetical protein
MFALLNPQPNGAGFAGVRTNITGQLDQFQQKEGFLTQVSYKIMYLCSLMVVQQRFTVTGSGSSL